MGGVVTPCVSVRTPQEEACVYNRALPRDFLLHLSLVQCVRVVCHVCTHWIEILLFSLINPLGNGIPSQFCFSSQQLLGPQEVIPVGRQ